MFPYVSIVVPLYNEEESLKPLVICLKEVLAKFTFSWELIFVDDGSNDSTWELIEQAKCNFPGLRAIKLRSNCGQTGAMVAGFDHSRGAVIVTLDGDLQNDPADIPLLLEKLNEGYDVVSGWRKFRKDHWSRVFPSRVANGIISWSTGVKLHDYGCSLKAYRADCVRNLHCYGEMHRFFPAMASMTGAKVVEVPVQHYARQYGTSKYGFERIFKVFSDIFAINLLIRFSAKPLKAFVLCSLPFLFLGFGLLILALFAWLLDWTAGKAMFFSLGCVVSFSGALSLSALGVLGELAVSFADFSHTRLIATTVRKSFVSNIPLVEKGEGRDAC
jgi:glycosyltransferase involved in cell wall biosynthesis